MTQCSSQLSGESTSPSPTQHDVIIDPLSATDTEKPTSASASSAGELSCIDVLPYEELVPLGALQLQIHFGDFREEIARKSSLVPPAPKVRRETHRHRHTDRLGHSH